MAIKGVKADVIFAAEGAGIGEGRRGDHVAQRGASAQAIHHLRNQLGRSRLLHQCDERFEIAEGQAFRALLCEDRGKTQVGRQAGANAGNHGACPNVLQEFAAGFRMHGRAPEWRGSRRRHPRRGPAR